MRKLLIASVAMAGLLGLSACNNRGAEDDTGADAATEAGMDASAEGGMASGTESGGGGAASAGDAGSDASSGGGMAGGSASGGSTSSGAAGAGSTDGQAYDPLAEGQGSAEIEGEVRRPTEPEHPSRS